MTSKPNQNCQRGPRPVAIDELEAVLGSIGHCAIAVSGGVDSMTLAVVGHRLLGADKVQMFHAVSAAVPPQATARVERYARLEGWDLVKMDAGEIADPRYVANPANRCYFCKTNLYGSMAGRSELQLLSGTNLDDLGDYRPGLDAANEHDVKHPYVEAGIDKTGVRAIAHHLGRSDLAELPAAPCLSSRVETGIAIEPATLVAINNAENLLRAALSPKTVRCRGRAEGVVVELDEPTLSALSEEQNARLGLQVGNFFVPPAKVRFTHYKMGSAFLVQTLVTPPAVPS